ncbi:leucine-rich repeat LGI family member 3-like [Sitophilus oryzae]|nr:leucine-rich repeat LGI family member 3-like [Sitophilus oryzae]
MIFENLNSLETLNLQNNKLMHIPEDVMEPILDTLRVVDIMDNPLLCDCELQWYKNWLRNPKDKDDEMMQKKRTVCTMQHEHREYSLQSLPLDKMKCKIKSYENSAYSAATRQAGVLETSLLLSICVLIGQLAIAS